MRGGGSKWWWWRRLASSIRSRGRAARGDSAQKLRDRWPITAQLQIFSQTTYERVFRVDDAVLALQNSILGIERGVFDPNLRLQICNLRFRLKQLLFNHSQLLHTPKRQRLRVCYRPQLPQFKRFYRLVIPYSPPVALLHSSCRLLPLILCAPLARLQLYDGPHSLAQHGGGVFVVLEF